MAIGERRRHQRRPVRGRRPGRHPARAAGALARLRAAPSEVAAVRLGGLAHWRVRACPRPRRRGHVGVLGTGQLGRMLALAARRMGYRVHVHGPAADTPAGRWRIARWWRRSTIWPRCRSFVAADVGSSPSSRTSTPRPGRGRGGWRARLRPPVLGIARTGPREKRFLADAGLPHRRFVSGTSAPPWMRPCRRSAARRGAEDGDLRLRRQGPVGAARAGATAAPCAVGVRAVVVEELVELERRDLGGRRPRG